MKLMIDLFSGLGGASEAFVHGPNPWAVLRYENNPALGEIPYTTLCDLTNFDIHIRHAVDLVWASPPCTEFSRGFHAPGPTAEREGRDFQPDLTLVKRAVEIIAELEPSTWVIENVVGSIKHLEPILGEPRQIIGPFVLWGNHPLLDLGDFDFEKKGDFPPSEMRPNLRAKVPLELSQALRSALENQTQLSDW